jgi:Domain of unknown function (DUF4351)
MTQLKRYWMVVHYETEFAAENEDEAYQNMIMGNRIVENATIVAKELPELLEGARLKDTIDEARLEAAVSILLAQLAHKTKDYSLMWERLSKLASHRREQIQALSVEQLECLSIEAIEFSGVSDLEDWLDQFAR